MKICRKSNNSNGFTLLEVLLAVTILGIVMLTMMSFFSQAFQYTKNNESKTVGVNVARNVLNYVETQGSKNEAVIKKIEDYYNEKSSPANKEIILDDSTREELFSDEIFNPTINNVKFKSVLSISKYEAIDDKLNDYLIPIKITVTWNENKKTSVEGVIKK